MTKDEIQQQLDKLRKARDWCANEFAKRDKKGLHPSFLVAELLKEADQKFELGGFGVEGWSTHIQGTTGVSYLNFGDPYICTLFVWTRPDGARFHVAEGGWAPYAPEDDTDRKRDRAYAERRKAVLKGIMEEGT